MKEARAVFLKGKEVKEEKKKKLEELYTKAAKSAQSAKPKRSLFSWKCPKCNNKLAKESVSELIVSGGEVGTEFGNKVAEEAGFPPGVYRLSIDCFSCKCGYEFANANTLPIEDNQ